MYINISALRAPLASRVSPSHLPSIFIFESGQTSGGAILYYRADGRRGRIAERLGRKNSI